VGYNDTHIAIALGPIQLNLVAIEVGIAQTTAMHSWSCSMQHKCIAQKQHEGIIYFLKKVQSAVGFKE
jgi:hypothetical protein